METRRKSSPKIDLSGKRFGQLTVLKYLPKSKWLCRCDCGKKNRVTSNKLRIGYVKSCGCKKNQHISISLVQHGHSRVGHRTKEYGAWNKMKDRCHRPNDRNYIRYGAKGITVCKAWRKDFSSFLEHIGPCPDSRMSIDRINNNKGYEPGNVRWATRKTQSANRSNCRYLTHDGKTMTIAEWADYLRLPRKTLYNRINAGLPVHLALVNINRSRLPNSEKWRHKKRYARA